MPTPNPGSHDYALLQIDNACKEGANTYQSKNYREASIAFSCREMIKLEIMDANRLLLRIDEQRAQLLDILCECEERAKADARERRRQNAADARWKKLGGVKFFRDYLTRTVDKKSDPWQKMTLVTTVAKPAKKTRKPSTRKDN